MGATTAGRPAAFLDRDGVINAATVRGGRPHPPASVDELVILPGVAEACRRLRAAGFAVLVVTNQPDIARGATGALDVARINDALLDALALDAILVCPHDDADACHCRTSSAPVAPRARPRRGRSVGHRPRPFDHGR
jgi:D-glycero-D-manno-heptose 1,7-bisphosphate phosphatase